MALAWPICRYPLGSGGKRVRIFAGSTGPFRCTEAGPGLPPHLRPAYLPLARSASTTVRMKFAPEVACVAAFFARAADSGIARYFSRHFRDGVSDRTSQVMRLR